MFCRPNYADRYIVQLAHQTSCEATRRVRGFDQRFFETLDHRVNVLKDHVEIFHERIEDFDNRTATFATKKDVDELWDFIKETKLDFEESFTQLRRNVTEIFNRFGIFACLCMCACLFGFVCLCV